MCAGLFKAPKSCHDSHRPFTNPPVRVTCTNPTDLTPSNCIFRPCLSPQSRWTPNYPKWSSGVLLVLLLLVPFYGYSKLILCTVMMNHHAPAFHIPPPFGHLLPGRRLSTWNICTYILIQYLVSTCISLVESWPLSTCRRLGLFEFCTPYLAAKELQGRNL